MERIVLAEELQWKDYGRAFRPRHRATITKKASWLDIEVGDIICTHRKDASTGLKVWFRIASIGPLGVHKICFKSSTGQYTHLPEHFLDEPYRVANLLPALGFDEVLRSEHKPLVEAIEHGSSDSAIIEGLVNELFDKTGYYYERF